MNTLNPSEISDLIKDRIANLDISSQPQNQGTIVSVSDGIVRVHGLADAQYGEMIEFPGGVYGMAMNLERDSVGAVVLGDYKHLSEGMTARCTQRIVEVPTGPELLGRVVDALGNPIDGKGPIEATSSSPVEKVAPGVIARQSVDQPVQTGVKCIDSMIPIGRGQRELIIGDRQIGKTALAVDTVINQKGTGIKCVYVAIGQKMSTIANIVRTFEEHGAMEHTVVVAAAAADPAPMLYISPYSGCAIGEYFRDRGEDALIIYDDLTKQAWAYRQVSLLLRRPPGREAYPGDIFYLHSRLLERAAKVNPDYVEQFTNGEVKGQSGSLTALPIIETQAGDVSAFVPTNVISITDGQIFLETDRFNAGIRPAMSPGISVSRVGGAAQVPFMKKISGGIKLALAQYRELAAFSQFASDLDEATRTQLEHGQRVEELMKQPQFSPMTVSEMGVSLFAANEGYLNGVPVNRVLDFERDLLDHMNTNHGEWMQQITESGEYSDEIEAFLREALEEFVKTHSYADE
ncbi:MAG: F0F1 ATP synthase subunit alpha [Gammaproteobacteria bacterium]|nr:F0F1 ATP synthase subunit alpha [Gammaproteobacteria bacterium]